jgi:hypothetical protein
MHLRACDLAASNIKQPALPFDRAEGQENALDVAGLQLTFYELLRLLVVWGGFVVGVGYRLSAMTE